MGRLQAKEMTSLTDLDTALTWHLQSNHYPPLPLLLLPVAKRVIKLAIAEKWENRVALPEGVSYKGETTAPVWACVREWHLDAFIS